MEKEEKKKLKYVTPTSLMMEFDPGCILAGSAGPGGWSVDGGGGSGTGASSGGWSIDDGGNSGTGASTGGWSSDGGSSGTGASTGGWTTN